MKKVGLHKSGNQRSPRLGQGLLPNEKHREEGCIPLLREGGVDATSRRISRSHLSGSGRGGWFKLPIIVGLNQPPFMLRAVALALRARLRELRSLREICLIAQPPLLL